MAGYHKIHRNVGRARRADVNKLPKNGSRFMYKALNNANGVVDESRFQVIFKSTFLFNNRGFFIFQFFLKFETSL